MCGIVGILGAGPVADQIVEALKRLEYRGYDSAGIATLEDGALDRRRAPGKLKNLELRLSNAPLRGAIGIGHTRWATHGKPNETNAHPHASERVAIVHNGIIENFRELREELVAQGHSFATETDSEVVAHLVTAELEAGRAPREAVAAALPRLRGAFALAFLFAGEEDLLIGARRGAPLAMGYGDGEMYLGSDGLALAPFTDEVSYLEEGDWVALTRALRRVLRRGEPPRVPREAEEPRLGLPGRQGQLPPLHGEGDPRAARGGGPHLRPLHRPVGRPRGAALRPALRPRGARPDHHRGLRHRLYRGADRQILVRAHRPPAGRHRRRERVPLPRAADGARAAPRS